MRIFPQAKTDRTYVILRGYTKMETTSKFAINNEIWPLFWPSYHIHTEELRNSH
jgi:hypothetical protein